tara:strand:- start:207 stop:365 length:159 start_codon:yes stop_codon:yes gene_type:complete
MDLLSWLTEHLVEELEHINRELVRVETYSERVELRRLKHDILEELHNRGENQ